MGREKKYIILTDSEKEELEAAYKNGSTHLYRSHCQAILLSASGHSISELSTQFSVGVNTIGVWLKKWSAKGLTGLDLAPGRGRKPKVAQTDTVILDRIENLLAEESQQINHILVVLEEEYAITMCKKTLKRLLRKKNSGGNVAVKSAQKSQQMSKKTKK